MNKLSDIEKRLEIVETRFREGSKRYKAARYIVRQNRLISTEERTAIINEIPITYKSLMALFADMRKMGIYPPPVLSTSSQLEPIPQIATSDIVHHEQQVPLVQMPDYVTKEELETLKESITYLASVINGEVPANPEPYSSDPPVEVVPDEDMMPEPHELDIQDPSLTRHSIWLKPKTQMYFDMARQGIFANYVGSRELGPFTQFRGNLSDFFNLIVDDYFLRNYNADIGILMRRYA